MFFLPILGNCNLEFISDIIIFRKPAVLTEALVLRKHCMWPQPLRLINLLLRYLQAQVSATLEISPSLITVYKMLKVPLCSPQVVYCIPGYLS